MRKWKVFDGSEGGFLLEKPIVFQLLPFLKKIEILMKNGSQNDAKIDAKIIKNRFWAATGATNVDLEYFLAVF